MVMSLGAICAPTTGIASGRSWSTQIIRHPSKRLRREFVFMLRSLIGREDGLNDLPAPLVPAEVDLRDFAFMPLDVVRLRDSDIATKAKGDEFRCAVLLWCAAWHQTPAASLPDDDDILSQYAGFGRVVREWKKIKAGALRGWVKCSDGRLYHPVVAEKANDAWRAKLEQRWRTECARIKKHMQRHSLSLSIPDFEVWMSQGCPQGQPLPVPETAQGCPQGHPPYVHRETHSKGSKGKGREYVNPESTPAPSKSAPVRFDPLTIELPGGISPAKWGEWIAYRRGRRLTTAEPTMRKQLEFLTQCQARGQPADAVIDASIANGWQGLFELKGSGNGKNGSSRAERVSATIAELTGANRHAAPAIDGVANRVD